MPTANPERINLRQEIFPLGMRKHLLTIIPCGKTQKCHWADLHVSSSGYSELTLSKLCSSPFWVQKQGQSSWRLLSMPLPKCGSSGQHQGRMCLSAPVGMPTHLCSTSKACCPLLGEGEGWDLNLLNTYCVLGPEVRRFETEKQELICSRPLCPVWLQTPPQCSTLLKPLKFSVSHFFRDSLCLAYLFQLDGDFI